MSLKGSARCRWTLTWRSCNRVIDIESFSKSFEYQSAESFTSQLKLSRQGLSATRSTACPWMPSKPVQHISKKQKNLVL